MQNRFNRTQNIFVGVGIYILFLIGNRISFVARMVLETKSTNMEQNIDVSLNGLDTFFLSFSPTRQFIIPSWNITDILAGIVVVVIALMAYLYSFQKRKNYRIKEEHGSARYGDIEKEVEPLLNKNNPDYSVIYSDKISITMDTRQTFLNNNTLTIGGSGSGKTRFHVKPDILNMACTYIVTDPKNTLISEVGNAFYQEGYCVKAVDFLEFSYMNWNPFKYIQTPQDVYKFVNSLVAGTTKNVKSQGGDEFFEKAEIALMTANLFLLLALTENSKEECIFENFMELIDMAEASEEDENAQSDLDILYEILDEEIQEALRVGAMTKQEYKNSWAFLAKRQYSLYKKAAGKTAKSILISVGVRLGIFNIPEVTNYLADDQVDLYKIGNPDPQPKYEFIDSQREQCKRNGKLVYIDENGKDCYRKNDKFYLFDSEQETKPKLQKTILFVSISDNDSTFSFLASILYQQLFEILYRQADKIYRGRLPIHVRFVLDEFANIGSIPDFERKIATMRSREISVDVILQNLAQLKSTYKESWETIEGNCDTTLFLGGKEYSTLERLSKMIGNTTVDYLSITENRGGSSNGSWSKNNTLISRALLAPDEIGRLSTNECLVHVRGKHIFRDHKYDLMKHPRIHLTEDGSKELAFNFNSYYKWPNRNQESEVVEDDTALIPPDTRYLSFH